MPLSSALQTSPWRANRQNFLKRQKIIEEHLSQAILAHGVNIAQITNQGSGGLIPSVDGLSTNVPGIFLAITAADCVPIFFYDPKKQAVALAHAGWRGLAAGIPEAMIKHLQSAYRSELIDIIVGLGPAIGPCHYDVQPDRVKKFQKQPVTQQRGDKFFLDLQAIAIDQFLAQGIVGDNIYSDKRCTFESQELFSYRRDQDLDQGVMMAVAGIR